MNIKRNIIQHLKSFYSYLRNKNIVSTGRLTRLLFVRNISIYIILLLSPFLVMFIVPPSIIWIFNILQLLAIILLIASIFDRLHDLGHTGWFSLFLTVPVLGLIFFLYLCIAKGDPATNKYGERTHINYSKMDYVLAYASIILIPILIIVAFFAAIITEL